MATPRSTCLLLSAVLFTGLLTLRFARQPEASARAASPEASPNIDCQSANTTVEINYCAGLSYKKADRALNQTYQQLRSTLSTAQKTKLTAAQQAWIEYRDKNCDFEIRNSIGGTGYSAFLSGCLERVTQKRTQDLQKQQG